MQVILKGDVDHLGYKGDVVDVKKGYWRNYLRPRDLAENATSAKVAEMVAAMERRRAAEAQNEQEAGELRDLLSRTTLTMAVQAGEQGKLFGSVTAGDIAKTIESTRKLRVDAKKVKLEEPIKQLGEYTVTVDVYTGVTAEVKIIVVAAVEDQAEINRINDAAKAEAQMEAAMAAADAAAEAREAEAKGVEDAEAAEGAEDAPVSQEAPASEETPAEASE